MTIRLAAGPKSDLLHLLDRNDDMDRRLGWTRCGIRFVWGQVDIRRSGMGRCPECGS